MLSRVEHEICFITLWPNQQNLTLSLSSQGLNLQKVRDLMLNSDHS